MLSANAKSKQMQSVGLAANRINGNYFWPRFEIIIIITFRTDFCLHVIFLFCFFSSIICLCRVLERSRIVMKHSCIVRCHLSCLRVPFFFSFLFLKFIPFFRTTRNCKQNENIKVSQAKNAAFSSPVSGVHSSQHSSWFTANDSSQRVSDVLVNILSHSQ